MAANYGSLPCANSANEVLPDWALHRFDCSLGDADSGRDTVDWRMGVTGASASGVMSGNALGSETWSCVSMIPISSWGSMIPTPSFGFVVAVCSLMKGET